MVGIISNALAKRNCFISYYHGDQDEVNAFVRQFSAAFTPVMLNVDQTYGLDLIESNDPQYVMQQIRSRHFGRSTVTIVLLGNCTHSRRYVDWEIKASLQKGGVGGQLPHGLLAITLPSMDGTAHLPERFRQNWAPGNGEGYANFYRYPINNEGLRLMIETAVTSRTERADNIINPNEMWGYNRQCMTCGITH